MFDLCVYRNKQCFFYLNYIIVLLIEGEIAAFQTAASRFCNDGFAYDILLITLSVTMPSIWDTLYDEFLLTKPLLQEGRRIKSYRIPSGSYSY